MKEEKIIIIDGSSYIFRAFFAIQRLSNSKGFPTNAIYGFINMLMKVLEVEKPKHLIITFDTAKPTFRKELYSDYKSNREHPPEELIVQIPYIFKAVDGFGILRLESEGFEADDIIGTLAKRAEKEGFCIEIITGDKDLMQLVNEKVTLYDTMKERRIDAAAVVERFGVRPDQIVDLLGLMGDASDNIPGVSGIGEKTAAELIRQFGSMDALYDRLGDIKQPKRRETLMREKKTAFLSRDLARVKCDVPLDFSWEQSRYSGPTPKLQELFEELEFQNLMKRFDFKPKAESSFRKGKYEAITHRERLKEVTEEIAAASELCVDTETTSLTVHDAKLVGISISLQPEKAYYFPVGHHELGDSATRVFAQLPEEVVREALRPALESERLEKIGQNLKYDIQILRRWGIQLKGVASDTLLASYLLNPDEPHNLDSLAFRHLGHQNLTYAEVAGTGKNQISFAEVPVDRATEYSGEDADVTLRLHRKLLPELEKKQLKALYEEVEVPLIECLAEMEYCGVNVDQERLRQMASDLDAEIAQTQEQIYALSGSPFNINSPKQLSVLLFEKLKLRVVRKTKTGFSTDESVLIELASEHEICRHIVRFRELVKLKGTYVEGLLGQVHPMTHRVHTNYNQTVAATGRLSSSGPNLQNIPTSSEMKYDLRAAFIPEPGYELLSADYSQVELRLLADMSDDSELVRAFLNGEDVHDFTGRLIFGTSSITADQRRIAKTINFGVIYGQTPFGLAKQLGITPGEARTFIDLYFQRYSGIRSFMEQLKEKARHVGYASTKLGRRRYLADLNSKNRMQREMAERAAINAPIQGTAADMIKIAMVRLHEQFKKEKLKARMILQVHDELVFEVPSDERSLVEKMVVTEMENALPLKVPLRVDLGWGKNWRECG